jgi:hypothetical protein
VEAWGAVAEQHKDPYLVTAEQLTRLQDYWEVFGSDKGKRVLEDMKKDYCGSCFSPDAIQMGFLNGERQVILNIEEILSIKDRNPTVEGEENG